jgi:hypothetical protein
MIVDWPAKAVDTWFAAHRALLAVATIVSVTAVVLMLVLASLGIRIGW